MPSVYGKFMIIIASAIALAAPGFAFERPSLIIGPPVGGVPTTVPTIIDIGVVKPGRPQTIVQPINNGTGMAIEIASLEIVTGNFALPTVTYEMMSLANNGSLNVFLQATGEGNGPIQGELKIHWGGSLLGYASSIALTANVDLMDAEAPNLESFGTDFENNSLFSLKGGPTVPAGVLPPQILASAALSGFSGLDVTHQGLATPSYVAYSFQDPRAMARVQFRFDPNSLGLATTPESLLMLMDGGAPIGWLRMRRVGSEYQLCAFARLDDGTTLVSGFYPIPDGPGLLTFDWWSALPGIAGGVRVRRDGIGVAEARSAAMTNPRVRTVRLGAVNNIVDETEGHLYFDDLEIRY